jgi:lipopolysaccharide/colanic/teichoic acid biosynthesis glycosyltransferase
MLKRTFDFVIALLGLLALAPLLIVISMLVRWQLGSPVFFTQLRPGLGCRPFRLVKFRTMIGGLDANGKELTDAERLTAFGHFLRSTSLDELPELYNVLIGDMSLVGPRPLLMEYLPLYNAHERRRHEVRPGITGWAQVNGRNAISWERKFDLDVWYVDNASFWLDLRILWLTLWRVLRREGIAGEGSATAERFTGNRRQ